MLGLCASLAWCLRAQWLRAWHHSIRGLRDHPSDVCKRGVFTCIRYTTPILLRFGELLPLLLCHPAILIVTSSSTDETAVASPASPQPTTLCLRRRVSMEETVCGLEPPSRIDACVLLLQPVVGSCVLPSAVKLKCRCDRAQLSGPFADACRGPCHRQERKPSHGEDQEGRYPKSIAHSCILTAQPGHVLSRRPVLAQQPARTCDCSPALTKPQRGQPVSVFIATTPREALPSATRVSSYHHLLHHNTIYYTIYYTICYTITPSTIPSITP